MWSELVYDYEVKCFVMWNTITKIVIIVTEILYLINGNGFMMQKMLCSDKNYHIQVIFSAQ